MSKLTRRARLGAQFAKAIATPGSNAREYAKASGVPISTLYRWRNKARAELALTEYGEAIGVPKPSPPVQRYCAHVPCGHELPLDSTLRRHYCNGRCRIAAFRAQRRQAR